jgi:L-alanine-DL-glutamate epimerase-like enolase superfamily enzyme
MRVTEFRAIPVRVPYRHREQSAAVDTGGVSNVVVRLATDEGLVGWGESAVAASTESVVAALEAMRPFVLGRDPWHSERIASDILVTGRWRYQALTAAFALAGIDMALWDLCGKAAGQPLCNLFGGPVRDVVDYFCYLHWDALEGLEAQCRDGVARGYRVFYLKVGVDEALDEQRLAVVRGTIGKSRKLRIDANQSWSPAEAVRLLTRWHEAFDLDFAEGPVPHHPVAVMRDLRLRVPVPLCADEGLRGEDRALDVILAGAADFLCLSPYDVGTLRRFQTLSLLADQLGQRVCKHTWGELGIYAACAQHLLLTLPNASDGHQQTAQMMADDVLTTRLPIADGPSFGPIDGPGLGVEVDEAKLERFHADYQRQGEFSRTAPSPRPASSDR